MASCILVTWAALALAAAGHRVKFKPVPDQIVAKLLGDEMLQLFYFIIAKLDHAAALQVDEVVVMRAGHLLVTRSAITKIVTRQYVSFFKQPNGAVNRGDADMRVDLRGAAIDQLDIRMIVRIGQPAGDAPALFGHLQSFVEAKLLEA